MDKPERLQLCDGIVSDSRRHVLAAIVDGKEIEIWVPADVWKMMAAAHIPGSHPLLDRYGDVRDWIAHVAERKYLEGQLDASNNVQICAEDLGWKDFSRRPGRLGSSRQV
jgi:hypothetical protein